MPETKRCGVPTTTTIRHKDRPNHASYYSRLASVNAKLRRGITAVIVIAFALMVYSVTLGYQVDDLKLQVKAAQATQKIRVVRVYTTTPAPVADFTTDK